MDGSTSSIPDSSCPDGTPRVITHLQKRREQPFQPDIFTLDCPTSAGRSSKTEIWPNAANNTAYPPILERRQACSVDCSSYAFCYRRGDAFNRDDCRQLTTYIRNRGSTQTVEANQQLVLTSGTCAYRYTNEAPMAVTWCDILWGTQSDIIAAYCSISLPAPYYGYCSADGVRLEVYNPATPPTSSAVVPSTITAGNGPSGTVEDNASSSPSDSFISNAPNSTSTNTSFTTATISTSLSIPLPGTIQGSSTTASSESADASVARNSNSSESPSPEKDPKTKTAIVAGIVVGVCMLLLALVIFWILRRRKKRMVEEILMPVEEQNTRPGYRGARDSIQHPMSEVSTSPSYFPSTPWTIPTKVDGGPVPRRTLAPAASAELLMTSNAPFPGAENGTSDSSMNGTGSHLQSVPLNGSAEGTPLPRQSMSTRMLAQTLAPDLSENDLDRLAQTIVARMQVTVNAPPESGGTDHLRSDAHNDLPPPAWRSSWGSDHHPTGPPRR
ncbi:hypothetical protein FRC18_007619 [Serendipita sp. 400]|nr:hypothetical protein FRC18_007619 [Serendipita sp. 400]